MPRGCVTHTHVATRAETTGVLQETRETIGVWVVEPSELGRGAT